MQTENLTEESLLTLFKDLGQEEVISRYNQEQSKEAKENFLRQINKIQANYPGGIKEYVNRAKILLENSSKGINPYHGYKVSIPRGKDIEIGTEDFYHLEQKGFEEVKDLCIALVAGGLGERLGYPDIKIGIETELLTKRTFFDIYSEYILAFESRMRKKFNLGDDWFITLAIMTSEDTHSKTVKLLKEHNNFGLKENQISIVMQEKFPSLLDNACHFAMMKDQLLLETKPHGHGDIHMLLYSKGIVKKWLDMGKKWQLIIQDTNVLSLNIVPSAIGVSKELSLCMNSITIPRKPGENLGSICKLTKENNELTINVEYNQLEYLLRESYNPSGDVANKKGLSDFPGNTNILLFELEKYYKILTITHGNVSEFINPKYADDTKTTFKSPARLECMMQDFPKLINEIELSSGNSIDAKAGFSMYDRWFCFSTCKNKLKDGIDRMHKGNLPETAFSIEQDMFLFNVFSLRDHFKKLTVDEKEKPMEVDVLGEKILFGPKILIYPSFACTFSELKDKMKNKIFMTQNSTLIIKNDIKIEKDIYVDGILTIENDVTEEIKCENKKRHVYVSLKENEGEIFEQIRGYTAKILP